jgi:hypothetical protein
VDDTKNEGYASYRARYEPLMQKLIAEHRLAPRYFEARKRRCPNPARQPAAWRIAAMRPPFDTESAGGHSFAKGAFVYHDQSAAPSRQQYFGGCLVR